MKKQNPKPSKKLRTNAEPRKKSRTKKKQPARRAKAPVKKKITAKQKKSREKLRRLRISRSHALRAYVKFSNSKKRGDKEKAREKFQMITKLNRKITDIEYVKVDYKRLTKAKGWSIQSFGHVGRAADNFYNWIVNNLKYFKKIDGFGMPNDLDLLLIRVNELVMNMTSENVLYLKYKDGIGLTYTN